MVLVDFFKRIEVQYKEALPFVVYRKPDTNRMNALLQKDAQLYFSDNLTETGFIFSPFDEHERTVLIPINNSHQIEVNVEGVVEKKNKFVSMETTFEEKSSHINLINKGVEAINNKHFSKVVLSRKETVPLSKTDPITIFKRLLSAYPSAFVYCWFHPNVGLWLGATPETLIKIEDKHFSIMALAGTQDYAGTTEVVWEDKEMNEQQIVTDFIVEHLMPLVDQIKVSETETVKAGNLLHLRTMISAQLKPESCNVKQLIFNIHPTPAVCGYPKLAAKKFILQNEPYNREFYTGFLGELNFERTMAPRSSKKNIENRAYAITKRNSHLYVNLRCMQIQGNQAHIYVGGGITKSSNAENEWKETVLKSRIIKSIL